MVGGEGWEGSGGRGGGGRVGTWEGCPETQKYSLRPRLNSKLERVNEFLETYKMHLNITGGSDGECPFPLEEGS